MENTANLTPARIDSIVLRTLTPATRTYWYTVALLFIGAFIGLCCWIYQIIVGIGVGGQNNPVAWGPT